MRLSLTLVRKSDGKTLRICRGSQVTNAECVRNDEDFGAHLGAWQTIELITYDTGILIAIEYVPLIHDSVPYQYEQVPDEVSSPRALTATEVLSTWESVGAWGTEAGEREEEPEEPDVSDYLALVDLRLGRAPKYPEHPAVIAARIAYLRRQEEKKAEEEVAFVPCAGFEGTKEGYYFGLGRRGLGYYGDRGGQKADPETSNLSPTPQTEEEYAAACRTIRRVAAADAQTILSGAFHLDLEKNERGLHEKNERGLHVGLPDTKRGVHLSMEGSALFLSVTLYRKSDGKCFGFCKDSVQRVSEHIFCDDCLYFQKDGRLDGRLLFCGGEGLMPKGSFFPPDTLAAELRVTRFGNAAGEVVEVTPQERQDLDEWEKAHTNHHYGWPLVVDEDTKRRYEEELEREEVTSFANKIIETTNIRTLLGFDLCLGHKKLMNVWDYESRSGEDYVNPRQVLRAWRDIGLWV